MYVTIGHFTCDVRIVCRRDFHSEGVVKEWATAEPAAVINAQSADY